MELVRTKEPIDQLAVSIDQLAAAIERSLAEKAELLAALKQAEVWVILATGRNPETTHPDALIDASATLDQLRAAMAHAEGTAP